MAIGNFHRMTPEEQDKAMGKEIVEKAKPEVKETKPWSKKK